MASELMKGPGMGSPVPLSRRRWLALSAGTLAAATAARFHPLGDTDAHAASGPLQDPGTDGRLVRSVCEVCFWKCGIQAHVQEGRITKIQGNPLHPLSNGKLCPRGTGGAGLAHDPDRLVRPLMRVGERGSDQFKPVSWDEALGHIASKLDDLKKKYGSESLAIFNHGAGASWFVHLFKAFGTKNFGAPSYAQCRGPRDTAFDLTYGAEPGSPEVLDIANTRCLVLLGSHLGENMHNTQVQDFARMVARHADLIVVDPRFSTAASKARTWLPIRPGTDTALLLAWMHVIVHEGRYNRDYVEKYTSGIDKLKEHLTKFTPEWAAAETGLDAAVIRDTARRLAGAAPAAIVHPGRHTTWYGADDTHRERAIAILNALLGSWGSRGGFFIPASPKLAPYPTPAYPEARAAADRLPGEAPFALEPLSQGIRRATIDGKPYPIKAWFVYGSNLIQALPQREETIKAIQALDLLVVVDVLPVEIAGWADVVLPEASYLERYDDLLKLSWHRGGVALRQPVVAPPGEAKPGWWIARQLAHKMNLGQYFPWTDIEEYLKDRCARSNLDFEQLKRDGIILSPPKPTTLEDGLTLTIATESGKIELYSEKLEKAGFSPMPEFRRPPAPPPGYFRLLYGRTPAQTFGRTSNNRQLGELSHGDRVWVNAKAASDLGIHDGDRVVLVNQDGIQSAPLRVKATERIRSDCVFMPHGWGHTAKGLHYAVGKGADDSALIHRIEVDPVMGGTGMRVNFVTLRKEA
jgi:thiosulfate reductase/polysulfide reductase chain A